MSETVGMSLRTVQRGLNDWSGEPYGGCRKQGGLLDSTSILLGIGITTEALQKPVDITQKVRGLS